MHKYAMAVESICPEIILQIQRLRVRESESEGLHLLFLLIQVDSDLH